MGLARIAGTAFADWGPAFQTVMMAIIMVNMLLGPPLFRAALIQVGEARAHALPGGHHALQQAAQQQSQQQSLHRDSSAGAPPLGEIPGAQELSEAGDGGVHGRHAAAKLHTSPAGNGGGWPSMQQRARGEQAGVQLSETEQQRATTKAAAGALLDPGEPVDGDASHHVVISSRALLQNVGARHAHGSNE
jgi:hypothetical protein